MSEAPLRQLPTPAPEILKDYDILIMSPSEWGDNAVSNMQIAALLSRNNTVAYIETMGGRMPRLSELGRVLRRLKSFFVSKNVSRSKRGLDPQNAHIVSPLAIPLHGNKVIAWLNTQILVWQVKRVQKRLHMTNPIIWSFSPRWLPVIEKLEPSLTIFHCVDGLHTYDRSNAFRQQFERTVQRADLVFTPGVLLERELHPLNSKTYQIGHGCGSEHLNHTGEGPLPEDLTNVPQPRVVYAGTLANWVDYPLLIQVAQSLPNLSFVLIGYIHALTPRDQVKALLALPNVYHMGYKNFHELPHYYRSAVVGLVPYQAENEHIQYSTPTKFLDYFAAGLPVVSTRYPAAESMGDRVMCATTPDEYAAAIQTAIADNSQDAVKRRRDFAQDHTWERQIAKMSQRIRDHLHGG